MAEQIRGKKYDSYTEDYKSEEGLGLVFVIPIFGIFWLMYFLVNIIEQTVIG